MSAADPNPAYAEAIARLVAGRDLDRAGAEAVLGELVDGRLDAIRIAALLSALAVKGETAEELVGFVRALRARMRAVAAPPGALDTCGTGGSGLDTPNTSTMVAVVVASLGVPVAKHGNRSSTGRSGSSDVLERLGLPLELPIPALETLLAERGLAFLFAPGHHPAVRHAGPVRRAIGVRTSFNFLGPLANPARVRRQVVGVSDPRRAPRLAEALAALGAERALVVHGEDGLDELSLSAPTRAWWVEAGQVREDRLTPEQAGLERRPPEQLRGGDPEANARLFEALLAGAAPAPIVELVALNAAAALMVAGRAGRLAEGVGLATAVLEDGRAGRFFTDYRAAARRAAEAAP